MRSCKSGRLNQAKLQRKSDQNRYEIQKVEWEELFFFNQKKSQKMSVEWRLCFPSLNSETPSLRRVQFVQFGIIKINLCFYINVIYTM